MEKHQETLTIKRRRIQARQYKKADEGKWCIETPAGKYWVQDKDWLIQTSKDPEKYVVIPDMAMNYIQAKDEE